LRHRHRFSGGVATPCRRSDEYGSGTETVAIVGPVGDDKRPANRKNLVELVAIRRKKRSWLTAADHFSPAMLVSTTIPRLTMCVRR
jgi:hypothetical protein